MKERKKEIDWQTDTEKICLSIVNHFLQKLIVKRKQERENKWLKKEWMNEVKEKQRKKEKKKERKKERQTDKQTEINK